MLPRLRVLTILAALGSFWTAGSEAAGPLAYVTNATSNDVSVVDTVLQAVVATVPVGNGPAGVAVDLPRARIYVVNRCGTDPACQSGGNVSVIDASSNTVVATVPVGEEPLGAAVTRDGERVYVANTITPGSLSVIDTATNAVIATVVGASSPAGIVAVPVGDAADSVIYVAGLMAPDTVSIIDPVANTVTATVAVGTRPTGLAVAPRPNSSGSDLLVYVVNQCRATGDCSSGTVSVIDTFTQAVVATIPTGTSPFAVATGSDVYVTNHCSSEADCSHGSVSVIDAQQNTLSSTIPLDAPPTGADVDPPHAHLYVATAAGGGAVSVIDAASLTVTATIPVGLGPVAFGSFIARIFRATSMQDGVDLVPGDGVCDAGDGACTLRAAIMETNALPGADTISLLPGTYSLTIAGSGGLDGSSGDLVVADSLNLLGAGPDSTTLDANYVGGAITLRLGEATNVRIADLSVTHGRTGGVIDSGLLHTVVLENCAVRDSLGAGVQPTARNGFTIRNCTISGNRDGGVRGGGVAVYDSTIADNTTVGDGGGIHHETDLSELLLVRTIVRHNTAGGGGGGIFSQTRAATLIDSVVEDNAAGGDGGGILRQVGPIDLVRTAVVDNSAGNGAGVLAPAVIASNVTLSGNRARFSGGGMLISAPGIGSTVNSSTITGNVADSEDQGLGDGGGIMVSGGGEPSLVLTNSIVAGNVDLGGEAPDCAGDVAVQGYDLIGDPTGCGLGGDMTGTLIGLDPLLAPLADNGGPTPTHALLPGSPARNAGSPDPPGSGGSACEAADQRSVPRPQPAGGRCDIGAVEDACANGVLEPQLGEQCDDGNQVGGDGCEPLCTLPGACGRVTVIPPAGGALRGVTSGAGSLGGTCGRPGQAPEQVFQWTPDTSGSATLETCGDGTDYDTTLYVRQGSCTGGEEVACNDDACPNASGKVVASRLTLTVTAGQPYFIVVDGWGESRGTFRLRVTPPSGTPVSTTSSTTVPTTSSTSTTLAPGCVLGQLPPGSVAAVRCAIEQVQTILSETPQPICASRCRCVLDPSLDTLRRLVADAEAATIAKKCRRSLRAARHRAEVFRDRVTSLTRRKCVAPVSRAQRLLPQSKDLAARIRALVASGFCAGR